MKIVDEIRSELKTLKNQDVYVFIVSLLSRQKNMFDRIAHINQWDGINVISEIYDSVKRNVFEIENLSCSYAVSKVDIEYFGWEVEEFYMQMVDIFLDTLFGFVEQLQHKDDIDYAFSQCNFDVLENMIINEYGWQDMNEDLFCSNEYVQLEYEREKRDLEQIKKGEYEYLFETMQEMLIPIEK